MGPLTIIDHEMQLSLATDFAMSEGLTEPDDEHMRLASVAVDHFQMASEDEQRKLTAMWAVPAGERMRAAEERRRREELVDMEDDHA